MTEITRAEIYKEQYAHFRSMNDILYKIPPLFTAILGGLWYFAVLNLEKDKWISSTIFAFAAVASVCFVNVMQRFRMAFNSYIDNLNQMDGDMKVSIKPSCLTINDRHRSDTALDSGRSLSAWCLLRRSSLGVAGGSIVVHQEITRPAQARALPLPGPHSRRRR